jgi:hypothetical protein
MIEANQDPSYLSIWLQEVFTAFLFLERGNINFY